MMEHLSAKRCLCGGRTSRADRVAGGGSGALTWEGGGGAGDLPTPDERPASGRLLRRALRRLRVWRPETASTMV